MAISSSIVFEVRTTGSNNNGGGFKTGATGTDWSQQNAAQYALTSLTTAAANAIILTASAAADMVGNIIQITGGTNFITGFYEITAVSAGVSITVDRNCTTAAGASGTANIGGALLTISQAALIVVAGNIVYIKSGTYSELVSITVGGNASAGFILWSGYGTSRNDTPTGTNRPLIDAASTRASCISFASSAADANVFEYLRFSGGTGANVSTAFSAGNVTATFKYCKSSSSASHGFSLAMQTNFIGCEANSNTGTGFDVGSSGSGFIMWGCSSHNNTQRGYSTEGNEGGGPIDFCLAYANANHGFQINTSSISLRSNTSTANTGGSTDGFNISEPNNRSWPNVMMINNISQGNGRDGFRRASNTQQRIGIFDYNDYQGNSGAGLTNIPAGAHDSTLNPTFTSSTNLAIGTNLKALGYPGAFTDGNSTGYLDMGAVQRQEPGAGGTFPYVG